MPTIWTNFVKEFSAKHGLKYACALSKYKEPLKKAYKLFKEGKPWYEPMTSEVGSGKIGGANKWTNFVKEYATKNNTTYGCALSDFAIKNAYKLFKDGKTWYFPKISSTIETQTDEFIEPEPVKAPENIKPVVNRIEEKIKQLEKIGAKKGAVSYDAASIVTDIAFVNLLEKYGGQCVVNNVMKGEMVGIRVNSNPNLDLDFTSRKKLGTLLQGCIKRGVKVICIPLSLAFGQKSAGHANMLIYRPFKRLVERFEPHGRSYGNSAKDNASFNKQLKELWEKDLTQYIGEVRFKDPAEICPSSKGFQSLEASLKGLAKEGGGFCSMWSYFLAEMTFINPDKSTKEIIDEVFEITKKEPAYLKAVIRGYVVEIEEGIDELLKTMGTSGFKFGEKQVIRDSTQDLQAWLLSVAFNSGKISQAPPDFEPLPSEKTESDEEKLMEIYHKKIKKLKKEEFETILNLYGLKLAKKINVSEMPYYLINRLIEGSWAKYGANGLKDIDIILKEELHKKKGAYKIGLAREGYFKK